ncbi:MAG: hypothetical protein WBW69_19870 [Candidatus Korobacteraceae bacterium]
MSRTLTFAFMLLGSAFCLQAQEGYPGLDRWPAPSDPPTVQGCLQNSSTHYFVMRQDGTMTRLTGNTAWLSRYVGHEMEVSGKPTVITLDTTEIHAASTAWELPALDVKNAKELAKACSSGAP